MALDKAQSSCYSTGDPAACPYGGNGTVTMLTKNGVKYTFYAKSSGGGLPGDTTGLPSASVTVNGQATKIRFNLK